MSEKRTIEPSGRRIRRAPERPTHDSGHAATRVAHAGAATPSSAHDVRSVPLLDPGSALGHVRPRRSGNLPEPVRARMEAAFGTDFSDVVVHEGSRTAKDLGAVAYTQGQEIYFARGCAPYSSGLEHLGHELSHVVQQQHGPWVATHRELGYEVSSDAGLERDAAIAGREVAAGRRAPAALYGRRSRVVEGVVPRRPMMLLREPIPTAAFVLDVSATADSVIRALQDTAHAASRQAADVNWRGMFYGAVEAQLRSKQLGAISHSWTDSAGIDVDWQLSLSFTVDHLMSTGRPTEERPITTSQGGSSSAGLGSSQSQTSSSQVSVGGEQAVEGGKVTGGVGLGDSSTTGSSQSAGGGLSGSQSQVSRERVNRFRGELYVDVDVRATAGYSNWDIINPVKWGAHLAGVRRSRRAVSIGSVIFDRPEF